MVGLEVGRSHKFETNACFFIMLKCCGLLVFLSGFCLVLCLDKLPACPDWFTVYQMLY